MSELTGRLTMLKQMRWRDAHAATGADNDSATDRLIRIHHAIVAMEAAAANGPPVEEWNVDINGWPLTEQIKQELSRSADEANARQRQSYDRYNEPDDGTKRA
jgi:hypothetical protein